MNRNQIQHKSLAFHSLPLIVRTTGDFGDVTKIIKRLRLLSPNVTFYDVYLTIT